MATLHEPTRSNQLSNLIVGHCTGLIVDLDKYVSAEELGFVDHALIPSRG